MGSTSIVKSVRFNDIVQVHAHAVTLGCYSGGSGGGPPIQLDWNCLYEMECPLRYTGSPRLTPKSSMERVERLLDAGVDVGDMWNAEAVANVIRRQRRESSLDHIKENEARKGRVLSPQGTRALRMFQSQRR